MRNNCLLLLLFLNSLIVYSQSPPTYTISGYIRDKESKELLLGVPIYIPSIKTGVVTNNFGFYSITLPKQDSLLVLYSYVGYAAVSKLIQLDKNILLNVDLEQSATLKTVEVVADRTERVSNSSSMSVIDIPINQIKELPAFLGEKDVLKVLQLMPGVQKGSEGSAGFYVRGGGADQNLIILDDAPVYNAFHLFGFFSLFNGDALKNVSLIKGGFPARYGGRLSSVVEMTMKDGNKEKLHGEGGIGLISSRLTLEGPLVKGKSSFLISARRTYLDILTGPIIKLASQGNVNTGYFFYDLNAKINYDLNEKNRLFLSGYFGQDKFYVKDKSSGYSYNGNLGWGNATATARWNHLYGGKLFSNTSFIFTDYKFLVSLEDQDNSQTYKMQYYSGVRDISLKYDIDYHPNIRHYIRFGILSTYHTFTPNALTVKSSYTPSDNFSQKTKTEGFENAIYVEDDFKVTPLLKINAGLRFTDFAVQKRNYFNIEPRFAASYNLKEDLAIKGSYTIMNQYIQMVSNTGVGLPTDLWVPSTKNIVPQQAQQVGLGIAKDFLKENFAITVEGYYKKMDHIVGFKEGASFLDVGFSQNSETFSWEKNVTQGKGTSYGSEFLLQRKEGKFTGWVGYTLSWTQLQFDSLNFGKKFYAKYDRRHDISVVGIYKFRAMAEKKSGITLSASWVYGTGNAITLPISNYKAPFHSQSGVINEGNPNSQQPTVNEFTEKNGFRMGAYHRFDVSIQFTKQKKRHERTWEFSFYNVYNRKNPFFYYLGTNTAGDVVLKQVSLFPIIPSFSYNFKF
ncbi:MAG: carboxypeptidase-like regulatory domain-containing protein [Bacteroidia bacterium]